MSKFWIRLYACGELRRQFVFIEAFASFYPSHAWWWFWQVSGFTSVMPAVDNHFCSIGTGHLGASLAASSFLHGRCSIRALRLIDFNGLIFNFLTKFLITLRIQPKPRNWNRLWQSISGFYVFLVTIIACSGIEAECHAMFRAVSAKSKLGSQMKLVLEIALYQMKLLFEYLLKTWVRARDALMT